MYRLTSLQKPTAEAEATATTDNGTTTSDTWSGVSLPTNSIRSTVIQPHLPIQPRVLARTDLVWQQKVSATTLLPWKCYQLQKGQDIQAADYHMVKIAE
jgi:hypothetical protein